MNKLKIFNFGIKPFFVLYLLLFSSCATTYYEKGHNALEEQHYRDAIKNLKYAIVDNIYDVQAIRDFGIAIYYKKKLTLATRFLRLAQTRLPDDPLIFYYLGLIYEETGQFTRAIRMYSRYVDVSPLNPLRNEIEGRLYVLLNRKIETDTQLTLLQEKSLDVISIPDNSIAVTYFANMSGKGELSILSKGLTDMLITDLSQVDSFHVVERARLQHLMEELGLAQTGLTGQQNVPRMAKLLGASHVVTGTLVDLGDQYLRVDANVSDAKTGGHREMRKLTGSLEDILKIEKNIAFSIIDLYGIKLTKQERKAIEKMPTTNMMAFMAYCRGLNYEDQGQWQKAKTEYNTAIKLDPNFIDAHIGMVKAIASAKFKSAPPKATMAQIVKKGKGKDFKKADRRRMAEKRNQNVFPAKARYHPFSASMKLPDSGGRLFRTAAHVNPGFIPSIDSREPTTNDNSSTFGTSAPIQVKIPVPTVP